MMKNIVNICLISFIVIHMVNGDVGRQNRRVKRLGNPNSRNISNKFKKGENFVFFIIPNVILKFYFFFFVAQVLLVFFLYGKRV